MIYCGKCDQGEEAMCARSRFTIFAVILILALTLAGCLGVEQTTPLQTSDPQYTQAAQTLIAEMTQSVPMDMGTQAVVLAPTSMAEILPSETPTEEPLPATSTPVPTKTPEPTSPPLPTETPTPETSPTPANTATPTWNVVYEDDLKSGVWLNEKNEDYRLQYSMGGYVITNNVISDIAYSVGADSYYDLQIEVTARRLEGPLDGYYGIICNFQNGMNYNFLGVGVDGWYGIGLKKTGQLKFLQEGMDQSGAVRTGNSENVLRAECSQGTLTLWANGIQLATTNDRTFTSGAVGLGVGNRKVPGTSVVFNYFKLFSQANP
jgi:hypothetical protein